MHIGRIAALAAALAVAAVAAGGAGATTSVTGTTQLEGSTVILWEPDGIAHQVRGADPAVENALVALAGRTITVDGTFDRPGFASSPILVQDFVVDPGGVLNGTSVTLTGMPWMLSDGGIVIADAFGHGHRLSSSSSTTEAKIRASVGHVVTVSGTAGVTNPASYVNWPIEVSSIS
jgi:hypothetical protein